ncbi:hypothetical protein ACFWFQ_00760 [Nocardia salmonicida]|uniref:hypothetical protein n=1 Tax=Nocardia salmonicida TaxID=53431 RepID=UPI0036693D0E
MIRVGVPFNVSQGLPDGRDDYPRHGGVQPQLRRPLEFDPDTALPEGFGEHGDQVHRGPIAVFEYRYARFEHGKITACLRGDLLGRDRSTRTDKHERRCGRIMQNRPLFAFVTPPGRRDRGIDACAGQRRA